MLNFLGKLVTALIQIVIILWCVLFITESVEKLGKKVSPEKQEG